MNARTWTRGGFLLLVAGSLTVGCGGDDEEATPMERGGSSGASGGPGGGGAGGAAGKGGGGAGGGAGSVSVVGGQGGGPGGSSGQGGAGGGGGAAGAAAGGSAGAAGAAGQGGAAGLCQNESGGGGTGGSGQVFADKETCDNGLDDDGNGFIDEGCVCKAGQTQPCYPGDPATADKGLCKRGTQSCEGAGEFTGWSACQGAVGPSTEVCEGKNDEDCDGEVDDHCGCCEGTTTACGSDVGACKPGKQTCQAGGVLGPCEGGVEPVEEICGNEIDDDCDGLVDEGCVLNVEINIDGDCVCSAPCPPQAPYPVGCQVDFQGNDARGCVAVAGSQVYFQEGDNCGSGKLTGKLTCSSQKGAGLNADNCPINKSQPTYGAKPSDCADADGNHDSCFF